MYAIIETGGKQYRVSKGTTVKVERLDNETGSEIIIDKVLVISDESKNVYGSPYITGAKVLASVEGAGKYGKVMVHKQRPRKVYRKTNGHRQPFTSLKINDIILEA